jgi:hypothetical protein
MADMEQGGFIPIVKPSMGPRPETFLAPRRVLTSTSAQPMMITPRHLRKAAALAAASFLAAVLIMAAPTASVRGQALPGYGAGIFAVDGASNSTFSIAAGGTYYLGVATDDSSSYVAANVTHNGALAAEVNASGPSAILVSLGPGNYSIALEGYGRAALGWDFTGESVQNFPDNESVVAFLRPASAHIQIVVSLGNAQEIQLQAYDDRLLPVTSTNVTRSGAVNVDLPATHATAAYLVASVVTGNPEGVFGLAWSSPLPPGPGLGTQIFIAGLWIGVPVVIALLLLVALRRRRRGGR